MPVSYILIETVSQVTDHTFCIKFVIQLAPEYFGDHMKASSSFSAFHEGVNQTIQWPEV
jgi:hypothetical protein